MRRNGTQRPPDIVCPVPGHDGGHVIRNGQRKAGGLIYQRYLCRPGNGDAPHTLRSNLPGQPVPPSLVPSTPERCPRHPNAHTTRDGRARSASGHARQMYRCSGSDDDPPHRFRPPLTRLAVDHGEACPECQAVRGFDSGDTSVARGHRFTTRIVADALERLAQGDSYGMVSMWARAQLRSHGTHVPTSFPSNATTRNQRKNAWRLSADWVEAFSPVLWAPWAAAAYNEVREALDGPVKDRPVVSVMLDDIPIFARARHGGRQKQRFSVLAASESFIDRDQATRVTRLRLLRAYPEHSGDAYKLLLAELGYVPDLILADGGPGIGGAVRWLKKTHPNEPFIMCLSAYHLRQQLRRQFGAMTKPRGFEPGDLEARLENWSFLSSRVAWDAWWADYGARMVAQGIPISAQPNKWINETKPIVDAQMEVLDAERILPRSTGALEATLFEVVKGSLSHRAQGFGNLVRTNRLLDLMVLRSNGVFEQRGAVAEQLNADARLHDGYAPVVRSITDARTYRSLLDDRAPAARVKELGL